MSTCETKQKQRDENRRKFPRAANLLDQYSEVFGDGVRLTYAEENGYSIGKRLAGYFITVDQWILTTALIEFSKKIARKKK